MYLAVYVGELRHRRPSDELELTSRPSSFRSRSFQVRSDGCCSCSTAQRSLESFRSAHVAGRLRFTLPRGQGGDDQGADLAQDQRPLEPAQLLRLPAVSLSPSPSTLIELTRLTGTSSARSADPSHRPVAHGSSADAVLPPSRTPSFNRTSLSSRLICARPRPGSSGRPTRSCSSSGTRRTTASSTCVGWPPRPSSQIGCSPSLDVSILQIEQTSLEFADPKLERLVSLTPADRRWMDDLVKTVEDSWNPEDPTRPLGMAFKGSDDDLRAKVRLRPSILLRQGSDSPSIRPAVRRVPLLDAL